MAVADMKQDSQLKTEAPIRSQWTFETLKAYIDEMFHAHKELSTNSINSLEKLLQTIVTAQDKAVNTAFVAQEKATATALAAQEKALASALAANKELNGTIQVSAQTAILKAEDAQKTYNVGHNDLARKMEDQYKLMLPRTEADQRQMASDDKIKDHGKLIADLTTRQDVIAGRGAGINQFIGWIIAALAVIGFLLSHYK